MTRPSCGVKSCVIAFLKEGWREAPGWSGSLCVRQEQLQQIVEKALPQVRRPDALVVAGDQPAPLGFPQRLFCNRDLQARALGERSDRKAAGQAQRVHHELEHEIATPDLAALLHRTAPGRALQV